MHCGPSCGTCAVTPCMVVSGAACVSARRLRVGFVIDGPGAPSALQPSGSSRSPEPSFSPRTPPGGRDGPRHSPSFATAKGGGRGSHRRRARACRGEHARPRAIWELGAGLMMRDRAINEDLIAAAHVAVESIPQRRQGRELAPGNVARLKATTELPERARRLQADRARAVEAVVDEPLVEWHEAPSGHGHQGEPVVVRGRSRIGRDRTTRSRRAAEHSSVTTRRARSVARPRSRSIASIRAIESDMGPQIVVIDSAHVVDDSSVAEDRRRRLLVEDPHELLDLVPRQTSSWSTKQMMSPVARPRCSPRSRRNRRGMFGSSCLPGHGAPESRPTSNEGVRSVDDIVADDQLVDRVRLAKDADELELQESLGIAGRQDHRDAWRPRRAQVMSSIRSSATRAHSAVRSSTVIWFTT